MRPAVAHFDFTNQATEALFRVLNCMGDTLDKTYLIAAAKVSAYDEHRGPKIALGIMGHLQSSFTDCLQVDFENLALAIVARCEAGMDVLEMMLKQARAHLN